MKKTLSIALAVVMCIALLASCGGGSTKTVTTTVTKTVTTTVTEGGNTPAEKTIAELLKEEPAYGTTIYYEYDTGNCTMAPLFAALLGYYDEYGLKVEGLKGNEIKAALGTNKVQFGVHHVSNLLVPITNGTPMVFTTGAQTGCKSLYVLADSGINSTADLKDKKVSPPEGIGTADYNILCRMYMKDGINPLDMHYEVVETSACIQAMKDGKIAGCILTDYYAYKFVKDGTLKCIRSLTWDEDFQDEPCCILAFNAGWAKANPVHTYVITKAVRDVSNWITQNWDEATQMLIDNHCTSSDDFAMNKELLMSQDFGITDAKVEAALRNIITDYISVGLIERYNASQVDEVMNLVWNPVLKNNYKA